MGNQKLIIMQKAAVNLSFCGCGFLGIYHMGVAQVLIQHRQLLLNRIHCVAGVSAGAYAAALLVCNPEAFVDMEFLYFAQRVAKKTQYNCAEGIFSRRPFIPIHVIQNFLVNWLPHDAYKAASGVLYVSLTNYDTMDNHIFNYFTSNKDLVQKYIDGALSNNLFVFREGRTVTISPFAGPQDISPRSKSLIRRPIKISNQDFNVCWYNVKQSCRALIPPTGPQLLATCNQGKADAMTYLEKHGVSAVMENPAYGSRTRK